MCRERKGCRRGRPNCRLHRAAACRCDAYWFPHRKGSGMCGHPERILEALADPKSVYNRHTRR